MAEGTRSAPSVFWVCGSSRDGPPLLPSSPSSLGSNLSKRRNNFFTSSSSSARDLGLVDLKHASGVKDWFLASREHDILITLRTLGEKRPELLQKINKELTGRDKPRTPSKQPASPRSSPRDKGSTKVSTEPIVQMAAPLFIGDEDEGEIVIKVVRFGPLEERSCVHYMTVDGSAKAGVEYVATEGMLIFEPKQSVATLTVPVISIPGWNPTTDFEVELVDYGLENAVLGPHLYKTTVKVLNNDMFPTNVHEEAIAEATKRNPPGMPHDETPFWSMLAEYVKWNLCDKIVKRRTIWKVIVGCLQNADFVLSLYLNVYLVDYIVNARRPENEVFMHNKLVSLVVAASFRLVTMLILHLCDAIATRVSVVAPSQVNLHAALAEMYLNYDDNSRKIVNDADVSMAATSAVPAIVNSYVSCINLLEMFIKLVLMLMYQASVPFVFKRKFSGEGFIVPFVFPVAALVFLYLRQTTTSHHLEVAYDKANEFGMQIQETVRCYRLIAAFKKRAMFITRLLDMSSAKSTANRLLNVVVVNNTYFARWVGAIAVAIYSVCGGIEVVLGEEPLGIFLANVRVYQSYAGVWGVIYEQILAIQDTFPALEHVMVLLNMPIDLPQRRQIDFTHLESTCADFQRPQQDTFRTAKRMRIVLEDIVVKYKQGEIERQVPVNLSGTLEVEQGQLICLAGPYGEGKSTLLRIVGGAVLPSLGHGRFHVPAFLKVMNINADPIFFHGTLLENLTLGSENEEEASLGRVRAILERLQLITANKKNIEAIINEERTETWQDELSEAERNLINLARALVSSPNVLCMHKPMRVGMESNELVLCVLQAFRDFVDYRGLELDQASYHLRQPRTCIMTSNRLEAITYADTVFLVSRQDGIRRLTRAPDQVLKHISVD